MISFSECLVFTLKDTSHSEKEITSTQWVMAPSWTPALALALALTLAPALALPLTLAPALTLALPLTLTLSLSLSPSRW